MLGQAIGRKMLKSQEMQEALQTIRAEIRPYMKHESSRKSSERENPDVEPAIR